MKSLLRLAPFIYPYRIRIILAFFILLGLTAIEMVFPAIIREVIDRGLSVGQVNILGIAAMILVVLGIVQAVLSFGQRYLTEWVSNHVSYDIRNRLYNHLHHLPFTYFDHIQSGQVISRCIEDVRSIERFTGQGVVELMRISLLFIAITAILFANNTRLAWVALLPMIPMLLVTTRFGKRIGRMFLVVDQALGELSSRLQENITGVQVVRAFAREPFEVQRFDQANRALFTARINVVRQWSQIMPTTTLLITIGTILILWFGGQMVLHNELTLGSLVAFNTYLLLLAMPAQQLGWLVNLGGEASAGVQRVMEILDHVPEIQSPAEAVQLPSLVGEVEFRDVSFLYSGESARALHHIRLKIQPNQVVALIGPTGSGKTSLVNLIPRFYDVAEGVVLIDGHDVRTVDLASLRKQIGIVLQSSLLFSTSIHENIAYGQPGASREEVIEAAKAAQAHEFIEDLPDGYNTTVGERGITLSGGQRQRIAIARALLMDPRILILDDSTSSVDTETEQQIQSALTRLMEGRTTFIIAQRLSTIRRADIIVVLDQGVIIERGKHAELLAQNGLYRQIYELQLRDQERFQQDVLRLENGHKNDPPEFMDLDRAIE